MADRQVSEVASRIDQGIRTGDLRGVASTIWDQGNNWNQIRDAVNQNLDQRNQQFFGNLDIVGTDGRSLLFKAQRGTDQYGMNLDGATGTQLQERQRPDRPNQFRFAQTEPPPPGPSDRVRSRSEQPTERPGDKTQLDRVMKDGANKAADGLANARTDADILRVLKNLPGGAVSADGRNLNINAPSMANQLNQALSSRGLRDQYSFNGDSIGKLTLSKVELKQTETKLFTLNQNFERPEGSRADQNRVDAIAKQFAQNIGGSPEELSNKTKNMLEQMKRAGAGTGDFVTAVNKALQERKADYRISGDSLGNASLKQVTTDRQRTPIGAVQYKPE